MIELPGSSATAPKRPGCGAEPAGNGSAGVPTSTGLEAALAVAAEWLDKVPGVVGVGLSDSGGEPTIDVWLNPATLGPNRLPESLHGIGVRVLDSGGSCPES